MFKSSDFFNSVQVEAVRTLIVFFEIGDRHVANNFASVRHGNRDIRLAVARDPCVRDQLILSGFFRRKQQFDSTSQQIRRYCQQQSARRLRITIETQVIQNQVDALTCIEHREHCIAVASITPGIVHQTKIGSQLIWQKRITVDAFWHDPIVHTGQHQDRSVVESQLQPPKHFDSGFVLRRRNVDCFQLALKPCQCLLKGYLSVQVGRKLSKLRKCLIDFTART